MKKLTKNLLTPFRVIVLAVLLSGVGAYAVYASTFVEPACAPPGCNAEAPLNVSADSQIKQGRLTVAAGAGITTGLEVVNGAVQIDGNAIYVGGSNYFYGDAANLAVRMNGFFAVQHADASPADIYAGSFFYGSDRSLKKDISPLQDSLSKISQLQGVSFDWKKDNRKDVGLIAQDVEKVYHELVSTNPSTGLKSVEYANLVAPLIEAVKAQQTQIDLLTKRVEELEKKN